MPEPDPMSIERTTCLEVVSRVKPEDFVPLEDPAQLPARVYFPSSAWEEEVFVEPWRSYDQSDAWSHSFHLADGAEADIDLVRREANVEGVHIVVTESSDFIHIRCDQLPPADFAALSVAQRAARLVEEYLNVEQPQQFQPIAGDEQYHGYSTNPALSWTTIHDWRDRIDAVPVGDGIALIVYKIHVTLGSHIDLHEWFSDEFREEHSHAD